jgi:hypothetical protein
VRIVQLDGEALIYEEAGQKPTRYDRMKMKM